MYFYIYIMAYMFILQAIMKIRYMFGVFINDREAVVV